MQHTVTLILDLQNHELTHIIPKLPPNHMCPAIGDMRHPPTHAPPPPPATVYSACPAAIKKQCVTPHEGGFAVCGFEQ
jgi:hypothetical protein